MIIFSRIYRNRVSVKEFLSIRATSREFKNDAAIFKRAVKNVNKKSSRMTFGSNRGVIPESVFKM